MVIMEDRRNILCTKGDTFNGKRFDISVNGQPITISSGRMQVKKKATDTISLLSFASGHGLTIGTSCISIDKQIINIAAGIFVYDIELTLSTGNVKTWISGLFTVIQDVTS
jgi:hypothetical protein